MTEITMPKLSDTMTEGVLGAWKKSVGDSISKGDILAEVETDKATMDLEAFTTGVLLEQKVTAGQTVAVGTVIGLIGEAGEAAAGAGEAAVSASGGDRQEGATDEAVKAVPQQQQPLVSPARQANDDKSSPVVRRRARELGVELSVVAGSGPGGRVLLDDLEAFVRDRPPGSGAMPATAVIGDGQTPAAPQPDEVKPLTQMRRSIIRTVNESWLTIPHFSVLVDIRMDKAEEMLRQLKSSGIRVSLNDAVIKAAALALGNYPLLNASLMEEAVILHREINIGLMAAVPGGLLVPVVKGCQALSLAGIAQCSRRLIDCARNGRLREQEMHGATFSISNLGMHGVTHFSALILPPQVAILAVGAVKDAVAMKKGRPAVERVMKVTLSADHRALDGAYAAEFLRELKQILECPIRLTL